MKAKINKEEISSKQMLAAIGFALAWSEHFIENKKMYKVGLEPDVFKQIHLILPDVVKLCTNLSIDIMRGFVDKKDYSKATVRTVDLYWVYRFATFYLEGVKEGAITDKRKLIDSSNFMYIHKIYKKADELKKELDEALEEL